jgi:ribosomal protein L37AE/L43A
MTYQIKKKYKCKECGSKKANAFYMKIRLCDRCYKYYKEGNNLLIFTKSKKKILL